MILLRILLKKDFSEPETLTLRNLLHMSMHEMSEFKQDVIWPVYVGMCKHIAMDITWCLNGR